jgi:hypothetical protein
MAASFLGCFFGRTGTEELKMRTLLAWLCITGFAVGTCTAQQEAKQERCRFDPASVVTATQAVDPLQSVASGTVVLEVSLDDAAKIIDIRVVRRIADGIRGALCAAVDVSSGKARWKAGVLKDRRGLLVRSAQYWSPNMTRWFREGPSVGFQLHSLR